MTPAIDTIPLIPRAALFGNPTRAQGLINHDPFVWRRLIGGAISWTVTWYRKSGPVSLDQLADMVLEMALKSSP